MKRTGLTCALALSLGALGSFGLGVGTGAVHADEVASKEAVHKLDLALERYYAKDYARSSPLLYESLKLLPESDLRRDSGQFNFADALSHLGFVQASLEQYIDIVEARRSPDLVGRSLEVIDHAVRLGQLDERRLIDQVLFGNQYGDLPLETADFVEYYQALGELRRGFAEWGVHRLTELAKKERYYGFKARYALGVSRLEQGNSEGAEKVWNALIEAEGTPNDVRNDARLALARQRYEQKKYDEAFALYLTVDAPITQQDVVLLEKAWDRVADEDEPRALGMVVGLGAPVYHRLFAPERALIRTMALKRLCQFRMAHLAVQDFRSEWGRSLKVVREHQLPDEHLRTAMMNEPELRAEQKWQNELKEERDHLSRIADQPLKKYLDRLYLTKLDQVERAIARHTDHALERVAEELLRIDEQMTILDYEIGVGLFRKAGEERAGGPLEGRLSPTGKKEADAVKYKFTGEYWSDELGDYVVEAEDRCVR